MKIKLITTLLLISINFIFSQEKIIRLNGNETLTINNPENGKIENGIYSCNRFVWKIKIPQSYTVLDTKELEELENKGNAEIKKRNEKAKIQNSTHLIGFTDSKNSFTSSFNPLDGVKKITIEEHKKLTIENLKQVFSTIKNAKFEFTTSEIKIGKYQFYKIKVEGFNVSNNLLVFTQIYYNSFISDHLFSALIGFSDRNQGLLLENNFLSSMDK
jgi:hypothetical protein